MKTNIIKSSLFSLVVPVILAGVASSCATAQVPGMLMEARSSLVSSSTGLTANLAPTYLDDAKQMLEKANREFAANGDSDVCRDYSYIAENKFELADVMARVELERQTLGTKEAQSHQRRSEEARSGITGPGTLASAR